MLVLPDVGRHELDDLLLLAAREARDLLESLLHLARRAILSGGGAAAPFTQTLTVEAGDRLEFSVGVGPNGTHDSDSTGLAVTITLPGGNSAGGGGLSIKWVVADHLGTPRMVLDRTGSLAGMTRHDYFPFGEEIGAGVGGRTTAQGYSQFDGNRKKWAKLERDDETGLDFAQARYYSNAQGRFTSPDSLAGSTLNPQTLNLYAYVQNNPLNFNDPTGHIAEGASNGLCAGDALRCGQQDPPRPTTVRPPAPEGYVWAKGGELVKEGGEAVLQESVDVVAKAGKKGLFKRFFGAFGKRVAAFGTGLAGGVASVFVGEMISPSQTVGGPDADIAPLPSDVKSTFITDDIGAGITPERLKQDQVFFRIFGDPSEMKGRFFTATPYDSSSQARRELAIKPEWNSAESIVTAVVPQGTVVYRGRAKAQTPSEQFPGGGSQVYIPDAKTNPGIKWGSPARLSP